LIEAIEEDQAIRAGPVELPGEVGGHTLESTTEAARRILVTDRHAQDCADRSAPTLTGAGDRAGEVVI